MKSVTKSFDGFRALYPSFDAQRYEALREVFGMDDTRPIRRLSCGMQKQAAFWIALSVRRRRCSCSMSRRTGSTP